MQTLTTQSTSNEFDDQVLVLSPKRCSDGNGTLSYLFFSDEFVDVSRAKVICSKCSSRVECLQGALERSEPWGVWGGELLMNGKVLAARRQRGRPPKIARPELIVDELGTVISA